MALITRSDGTGTDNVIHNDWFNDFKDLLTGVMTDQPVTIKQVFQVEAIGAAPSVAPTAALATGTALGVGTYQYVYTYISETGGESLASPVASITTTSNNQKVNLSAVAVGPTGTTARKVYRTKVGIPDLFLLTTINDNTTTVYADTTADASLATVVSLDHDSFGGSIRFVNSSGVVTGSIDQDGHLTAKGTIGTKDFFNVISIHPSDGEQWEIGPDSNGLFFYNATLGQPPLYLENNGDIAIYGVLKFGAGAGGYVDWYAAGPAMQYWTPQSGAASGHEFISWNGSAQVVPFSIGGQFGGALSWVDDAGTFFGKLQTVRNGTAQGNTIFTGTTTPSSPSVGDIWIKA